MTNLSKTFAFQRWEFSLASNDKNCLKRVERTWLPCWKSCDQNLQHGHYSIYVSNFGSSMIKYNRRQETQDCWTKGYCLYCLNSFSLFYFRKMFYHMHSHIGCPSDIENGLLLFFQLGNYALYWKLSFIWDISQQILLWSLAKKAKCTFSNR